MSLDHKKASIVTQVFHSLPSCMYIGGMVKLRNFLSYQQIYRHVRGPSSRSNPRECVATTPDSRERGRLARLARCAYHRFPQNLRELRLRLYIRYK